MHVVLAAPSPHDIHTPLRKQFGETKITVLSSQGTIDIRKWEKVVEEIVENVKKLPDDNYYLLVAGMAFLNIVAYQSLMQRFGNVNLLVYDIQKRKYVKIESLPLKIRGLLV